MQYRTFGKLNWKPSALGFGCMRLPIIGGEADKVDEPEATRMIRWAIDQGINYIDTAYPYHRGNSELVLGRALQDGYRQRVHLATKLPVFLVKKASDFDSFFNEQLARLQTDYIDMYLLHSLSADTWHKVRDLQVLDWAKKELASGRIHHFGFSFHDKYEAFQEIVDASDLWSFCQIQYNYMDEENQAGTRGLQYAASKGLGVVIMEPLRGGALTQPSKAIQNIWDGAAQRRTPAEWGLQWIWNHPEVSIVLSGMSTMQQVQENVASAERSGAGSLSADDLAVVARVRDTYRALSPIPCTRCQYCQPCPNGVAIPRIFQIYNEGKMFNAMEQALQHYNGLLPEAQRADQCQECGECESKCPQQIEIIDWLQKAHETLSSK